MPSQTDTAENPSIQMYLSDITKASHDYLEQTKKQFQL
jgi:hypothetical protein